MAEAEKDVEWGRQTTRRSIEVRSPLGITTLSRLWEQAALER